METKIKEKEFDTVKFFRKEKERIAKETEGMTFEELKAYIKKRMAWSEEKKKKP